MRNTRVTLDMFGKEFTEGDRVVTSTNSGMRAGKVVFIQMKTLVDVKGATFEVPKKVFIDLSEHKGEHLHYKVRQHPKRMGYEYLPWKFLKL